MTIAGTPLDVWKLIGLGGTGLFAGRWALQWLASRRAQRSVVPPTFWLTSLAGSVTLILYFAISPYRDLVGVMGNLLPAFVSGYNLLLLARARKTARKEKAPGDDSHRGQPRPTVVGRRHYAQVIRSRG